MAETVLVTGAFGLVGSATVKRLAVNGRRVVASGHLRTPERTIDLRTSTTAPHRAAAR